ncbi:NAD-dependent epimerase/dehydratase family protein [Brevundimonas sp.]|uniref:NAD-dependent epimerase/dehydratase family protein n=1 Tax=Brevundimonas sp. TaxID=1871086 RepID=UPI002FC75E46
MSRKALVTGATGGLGLALVRALLDAGYAVTATGRSAPNRKRLEDMGATVVIADLLTADLAALVKEGDVVFHAAALSSPWGREADFRRINVDATAALMEAAAQAGCDAFVFVSSPSVHSAFRDQTGLTEESEPPARALNAYARTKREAERRVLNADRPSFRTVVVRPRALIGPDDRVLLPRILGLVRRGVLPVLRNGAARIDLTDVRDAARALVLADIHRHAVGGQAVNISGGRPVGILDFSLRLSAALGIEPRLVPMPMSLMRGAARAFETIYGAWPGRPEPPLTSYTLATLAYSQTFDLTFARTRLGYEPRHDAVETALALARGMA